MVAHSPRRRHQSNALPPLWLDYQLTHFMLNPLGQVVIHLFRDEQIVGSINDYMANRKPGHKPVYAAYAMREDQPVSKGNFSLHRDLDGVLLHVAGTVAEKGHLNLPERFTPRGRKILTINTPSRKLVTVTQGSRSPFILLGAIRTETLGRNGKPLWRPVCEDQYDTQPVGDSPVDSLLRCFRFQMAAGVWP